MKRISMRLFFYFAGFMVLFTGTMVLLNTAFMERYYIFENRQTFIDLYHDAQKSYGAGDVTLDNWFRELDKSSGITALLYDDSGRLLLTSSGLKGSDKKARLSGEPAKMMKRLEQRGRKDFLYGVLRKETEANRAILFVGKVDDQRWLVLRKPIKQIQESTRIANRFFLLSSLGALILGSLGVFAMARRLVAPIVSMSQVSRKLASMDLDQRVQYRSPDELGDLGKNINLMADRLQANLVSLQEDVERRKSLVRNISHELKTPIAVIKGYAEGLQFGVAENPQKADKYCSVIAKECDRMDGMVKELLTLSSMESGTYVLNLQRGDLRARLNQTLLRFEPGLSEKQLSLSVTGVPELEATFDFDLMDRVIANFMTNSIKYTPEGGWVTIHLEQQDGRAILSVTNAGLPLSPTDLERIWDVFYKADPSRTREGKSHGLGLPIVRQIALLHQGACYCENVDSGVRFTFWIPA